MATKTKRLRILNEIYATLPEVECKGLCWTTCAFIHISDIERRNIEQATGKPVEVMQMASPVNGQLLQMIQTTPEDRCSYLVARRCSVYEQRPLICRVFGAAAGLPCRHGCQPTRVVPDNEVQAAIHRINKL